MSQCIKTQIVYAIHLKLCKKIPHTFTILTDLAKSSRDKGRLRDELPVKQKVTLSCKFHDRISCIGSFWLRGKERIPDISQGSNFFQKRLLSHKVLSILYRTIQDRLFR